MADKKQQKQVEPPVDDLMLEVKEHIEREKLNEFFKKYGVFLAYCALAVIVFFGGYEGWKSYDAAQREGAGDKFLNALQSNDKLIKTESFADNHSYSQLAQFAKAGQLAQRGKTDKAIEAYQKIWEAENAEPAMAKIAKIKAAILMINNNEAETPAWLNSDDDKIFNSEFNELVAIHALENGNDEKAEKVFNSLSENQKTTPTVKNRANEFLSQIN